MIFLERNVKNRKEKEKTHLTGGLIVERKIHFLEIVFWAEHLRVRLF